MKHQRQKTEEGFADAVSRGVRSAARTSTEDFFINAGAGIVSMDGEIDKQ